MKIISQKQWNYQLSNKENELFLSVVCGSAGMFELEIKLNVSEKAKYHKEGDSYIDQLAESIRNKPSEWMNRKVN